MTEEQLAQLQRYHEGFRKHHAAMVKHYAQRRKNLRIAKAKQTSVKATTDILDKLKSN